MRKVGYSSKFGLGIVGVIVGCSNNFNFDNDNLVTGTEIETSYECGENNGVWRKWTRLDYALDRDSCNIRSNDYRSICQNSSDCEGYCIDVEENRGRCSEFRREFGCIPFFENGDRFAVCFD